jgi:site-specific DNA recombinase
MTMRRAAIYARVSTVRQAEADISMPDQVERCRLYCESKGWIVSEIFEEPGASALDDDRPVFKRMIEAAKHESRYFDVVVVHSFSRFSRDALHSELYIRALRKSGVELISISQEVTADPMGEIVRRILNMLDELQSRENAKHTSRAMLANAAQGFWNGAPPPFGYVVEIAEMRGKKAKKRLAIAPLEADQVREVFALASGQRIGGPVGLKEICKYLNQRGSRRRGQAWAIGSLHNLLRDPTYVGRRYFNMYDTRNKRPRPQSEWVVNPTPSIVSEETFASVQAGLIARRVSNVPSRVVNGPTLLAGLVRCEACGAAMIKNSGKGGRYTYYSCSTRLKRGATECAGHRVPMEWLDNVVLDELLNQVLTPARLRKIVEGYIETAKKRADRPNEDLIRVESELTEVSRNLGNLLRLVEIGAVSADDPDLKPKIENLVQRRDQLTAKRQVTIKPAHKIKAIEIDEKKFENLGRMVSESIRTGDPKIRQAYLRQFVGFVGVSDKEIRIAGCKIALVDAATKTQAGVRNEVLTYMREWRPLGDSNPCHHRERVVS